MWTGSGHKTTKGRLEINNQVKNVVELTHFKRNGPLRIIFDASKQLLGMADFLSRHPSPYSGAVIKSEQMFNDWFTINVVNEFAKDLDQAITVNGKNSTKMISGAIGQSEARTRVFTVSE